MIDGPASRGRGKAIKLEDIAREAGVSISTVSRALSGSDLVNPETRRRIRGLADAHHYDVPRRQRGTGFGGPTLAVVMPPSQGRETRMSEPFMQALLGGIGDATRERDADLFVSHIVPGDYETLTELVERIPADGTIFMGQSLLHDAFNRLADQGRQFVVWGAQLREQHYCSIGSDNVKGGHRATSHLVRLGRKRIAFVGDVDAPESAQRARGYRQALAEAGLPIDPMLIRPAHFYPESGVEAVDGLIDQGVAFDGIVAASDMIALGAIRGLIRSGRRVPDDVSVIGYDDVDIAAYTHPALSTIRQDTVKAGRLLVTKLMRMLGGHAVRSERLSTELIVRESCGA